MFNTGKIVIAASVVGMSLIGAVSAGSLPAGAATSSVVIAPKQGLLSAADAKQLGFPKSAGKPSTTNKTGEKGCSKGAQAGFEDSAGQTGLISEIIVCNTSKAAASVLATVRKSGSATVSMTPPKELGSSAFERAAEGTTYVIYWQRGRIISLVGFDTNVPASSSTSTTTSATPTPLTTAQQQTLSNAAQKQDAGLT